jgi:hypothetical protein
MAWVAPVMMVVGTVMQMKAGQQAADAKERAGMAQQQAANYQADRMDERANAERASSQRVEMNERKRERLVQSNLQARAAASGAGAIDPTTIDLAEDIAAEGDYRARTALFEGEERGRGLNNQAELRRYEGQQAAEGAEDMAGAMRFGAAGQGVAGIGSAFSGGGMGSLFSKFGGGGPTSVNTAPYYTPSYSPTYGPYGQNGLRPY